MGPLDHSGVCRTCHSKYAACSGHPGHIELYFPVGRPIITIVITITIILASSSSSTIVTPLITNPSSVCTGVLPSAVLFNVPAAEVQVLLLP